MRSLASSTSPSAGPGSSSSPSSAPPPSLAPPLPTRTLGGGVGLVRADLGRGARVVRGTAGARAASGCAGGVLGEVTEGFRAGFVFGIVHRGRGRWSWPHGAN
jgi:hypothetical protein